MRRSVGLDFGTTNSAIGVALGSSVSLARFAHRGGLSDVFRSILYFHPDQRDARRGLRPVGGVRAIDAYLEADGTGRLIQSLKSYLADRTFDRTSVFGRALTLSELMTLLLLELRREAEAELGPLGPKIVVGRPVHFVAEQETDDAFALGRLRGAIEAAGFEEVTFEYEPVAAAYHYESRLDHDELVLIADFGGGTSDFSLVEVGPSRRGAGSRKILGNDGVGVAGDVLDSRILHHLVAPRLGLGSTYRSMFDHVLPVPVWIYAKLRRWHHLSFLKSARTTAMLSEIEDRAERPAEIAALRQIIDDDLGYHLYRAVERAKVELSSRDETELVFEDPPLVIRAPLRRSDFEDWIAEDIANMTTCVDRLLATTGVAARDVDRVFMTGGTSFVPAVRRIFDERFGRDRVTAGDEMTSVAAGLALRAAED
jgi:hypothetical chaperone protein